MNLWASTYSWYFGAVVLALASVAILYFWWRGDPARGRRRCPRCWYDMHATPGLTCSECGRVAATEAALLRPRRRRWLVALGVLMAVGCASCAATPWARRNHWTDVAPLPILVWHISTSRYDPDLRHCISTLNTRVRRAQIQTWGSFRDPEPGEPTPALSARSRRALAQRGLELFEGATSSEQDSAGTTLLLLAGPEAEVAVPALIARLEGPPPLYGYSPPALASLISRIGPGAAPARAALAAKLRTVHEVYRLPFYAALGAIGPAARDQVPSLLEGLPDLPEPERIAAVRAIARIHPEDAEPSLITMLDADSANLRNVAIELLRAQPASLQHALSPFDQQLRSPDAAARARALLTIRAIGPAAAPATTGVVELLTDDDPVIRHAASLALEAIGPRAADALPALTRVTDADPEPAVRKAAAAAQRAIASQR